MTQDEFIKKIDTDYSKEMWYYIFIIGIIFQDYERVTKQPYSFFSPSVNEIIEQINQIDPEELKKDMVSLLEKRKNNIEMIIDAFMMFDNKKKD